MPDILNDKALISFLTNLSEEWNKYYVLVKECTKGKVRNLASELNNIMQVVNKQGKVFKQYICEIASCEAKISKETVNNLLKRVNERSKNTSYLLRWQLYDTNMAICNCLNNMNLHWGDENLRYEEFEHVTKLHLLHLLMIWKTSLNFAPLTLPLH